MLTANLTGDELCPKTHAALRRRFLKTTIKASTLFIAPQVIAAAALGRDGAVAPSERIVMGGIGIGNRGAYDLGCFLQEPDVQFVAIADAKAVASSGRQEDGGR